MRRLFLIILIGIAVCFPATVFSQEKSGSPQTLKVQGTESQPVELNENVFTETEPKDTEPFAPPPLYDIPQNIHAQDVPNDKGQSIEILWDKIDEKTNPKSAATTLEVLRKGPEDADFVKIGETPEKAGRYIDTDKPAKGNKPGHTVSDFVDYQYKLRIKEAPQLVSSAISAMAKGQWYHTERTPVLIATLLFVFLVLFFISSAKKGKKLYIRPISGINAVEEAVGRATEMGKPVVYIPGIGEIQEVATLAGLTILAPIAEKTAEYDTPIIIPNRDPVVFSVAQEVVREAYTKAGRPDAFREDSIYFLSGRQFAYAAAVSGTMMREKPAACFYFGMFYAESLILAETGAATGAIQIAGTDQVAQLPFFIATCDYTLIGEELYAASAYLSNEPVLVGSLKAQDWAKLIILVIMAVGVVSGLLGWTGFAELLGVN